MDKLITEILQNEVLPHTITKGEKIVETGNVIPVFKKYSLSTPLKFKVTGNTPAAMDCVVTFSFDTWEEKGPFCTCMENSVRNHCMHITACLYYLLWYPKLDFEKISELKMQKISSKVQHYPTNYVDYNEITKGLGYMQRYELESAINYKSVTILSHYPEKNQVTFEVDKHKITFNIYDNGFDAECTCTHNKSNLCLHTRTVLLLNYHKFRNPLYLKTFRDTSEEKENILKELGYSSQDEIVNELFEFYFELGTLKIREKKNVVSDFTNADITKRMKSLKKSHSVSELSTPEKDSPDGHILLFNVKDGHPSFSIHPYTGSLPEPQKLKAKLSIKSKFELHKRFPEFANLVFAYTTAGMVETLREHNHVSSWYRTDSDEIRHNMTPAKWEIVYSSLILTTEKNMEWLTETDKIFALIDPVKKLHPTNLQALKFSQRRAKAHIKTEKKQHFLEVSPQIVTDGEIHDLKGAICLQNILFIKNDEVFLIDKSEDKILLDGFPDSEKLKIPNGRVHEFIKDFVLPIRKNFSVEIPDDLLPERIQPSQTRKAIRLKELEPNFLIIEPFMIYDEDHVSIYEDESFAVKGNKTVLIERNLEEEASFETFLQGLHPDFSGQQNYAYFYLSIPKVIQKQWFFDFFRKLDENQIQVFGHKELKKLNFNPNRPKLNISGGSGIDWFDLKIELSYGDEVVPLKILKTALVNKQDYVILSDGSFGMLPEEWIKKFTPILKIGTMERNKLRMSKLHFGLLDTADEYLSDKKIKQELQEKKERLSGIDKTSEIPLPQNIQATMRPYQEAGFQWFNKLHQLGWGGCLADDMGLGKTLQSLSFIRHIHNQTPTAKTLIVCPTSLIYNWVAESQKFTPDLRTHIYHGLQREFAEEYDLLITTYGTFRNDLKKLKEIEFEICILDESQAIKNPTANVSKAVNEINAKCRFVLSGTPLQNNTFDLYSQFNFINPGLLGSQEYFKEEFANPIDKYADSDKSQLLRKMIYPFMLRRTKEQVATDLPDKTESIIYCEMDTYQRKVYDALKIEYRNKILGKIESEGLEKTAFLILEGLNRLRLACDCPSLIKDEDAKRFKPDSVKLKELIRELDENSGQHKVLVFSQFLGMLDLIKEQLNKKGIKHLYLDGSTPAKDRQGLVDTFQRDDSIKAFLISLKAGGVGLNLTAADYVYIVDPWWNPAVEDQAIDRTHRIGQSNKVFAYKLICKDSIEEKIHQLQQKKKALAKEIVAEEASFIKKLTKDDVAWLLE